MVDKRLLLLLAIIFIYVIFVKPLTQKTQDYKDQLAIIAMKIAKEEFILKQKQNIKKLYPQYQKIVKENQSRLFPASTPISADLSQLQGILKDTIKSTGMELVSINWGQAIDKGGYKKLPLSFIARCYPNQLSLFLKKLLSQKKLIRFEQMTISKYQKDKLLINAIIVGFKLKK